jgi:hypothetical protein
MMQQQQMLMGQAGGQAEGDKSKGPTQDTGPRQRLTGGAG